MKAIALELIRNGWGQIIEVYPADINRIRRAAFGPGYVELVDDKVVNVFSTEDMIIVPVGDIE